MASTTFLAGITLSPTADVADPRPLYQALHRLRDPRKRRGRRYPLPLVLTLMVLAKLAGETKMSGIADWARLRTTWLPQGFGLKRPPLPGANTYTLVSSKVDRAALNAVICQGRVRLSAKRRFQMSPDPRSSCPLSATASEG